MTKCKPLYSLINLSPVSKSSFPFSKSVIDPEPEEGNFYALSHDGDDDFTELGTDALELETGDKTIEFYYKFNQLTWSGYDVRHMLSKSNSTGVGNRWSIRVRQSDQFIGVLFKDNNNNSFDTFFEPLEEWDEEWHHMTLRIDRDDEYQLLYDFQQLGSQDISGFSSEDLTSGLRALIAAYNDQGSQRQYCPVIIDELRFWDEFRNDSQLQDNAEEILDPEEESTLLGYWRFEEGEGDTVEDLVGDFDGTLEGEPEFVEDVPFE